MRVNWWLIASALFCFLFWWGVTTLFVNIMAPFVGNYGH
jgi:hypothetical protein